MTCGPTEFPGSHSTTKTHSPTYDGSRSQSWKRVNDMKLGSGTHLPGTENPCVMEYVSRLQGEEFSDHPVCVHPVIASAARAVNDWMPDGDRDKLLTLVSSMVGTS